jgi:hypothetical protein
MGWKVNKKLVDEGYVDLKYLPKERCGWDMTLATLVYGIRMELENRSPDLNVWAASHGVSPSRRYVELGSDALVLWHGTSRERAEKIETHGLFRKRGLWTALNPQIAHSFCRARSGRFGTEGAVVCILLDRNTVKEGHDYSVEGRGDILRFHHRLPPDVVEYVLYHSKIEFTGELRASHPKPWGCARFKKREGKWIPLSTPPVHFSEGKYYSTLREWLELTVRRVFEEFGEVAALEVFSRVYSNVKPWEAVSHEEIFESLRQLSEGHRIRQGLRLWGVREKGHTS